MKTYNTKLIVLRGNSGSGKSTVAKLLKEKYKDKKIALIEQDYLRRNILGVKDKADGPQQKLILNVAKYCCEQNYDILIVEGILTFNLYKDILSKLEKSCVDNHFYYFQISLDETLRRHDKKTEDFKLEVPTHKIRSWYLENDLTRFASEKIISEGMSEEEIVEFIFKTS